MLFNSWQFIFLFLPVAALGFFLLPASPLWVRKSWLLAASLFFYGYWKIEYIPLLLFSIGCNYLVAVLIHRYRHHRAAHIVFVLGIAFNLLLLGYYKYTNFFLQCLGRVTHNDLGHFDIILPLAISFFTFTQISYVVDVYRNQSLHYRFVDYALFVVFFPHLIAGPIVRHWEVIPQFARRQLRIDVRDISAGIALFLIGLYKKVLLADPLSNYVADVYGAAAQGIAVTWFDSWFGTLAFGLQIYFDFSAYSDMAIGLARLFGIKFPINFASPYQATSINEFWMRWHITLTRFLREYVYIPLGGNRCGPWKHVFNIMATMLLSGLWHGAGLTYIIWGALHGFYLVVASRWQRFVKWRGWNLDYRLYRVVSAALTLLAVFFAWVFFRAPNMRGAIQLAATMFGRNGLTIGDDTIHPTQFLGRSWAALGGHFVHNSLSGVSGSFIAFVVALLIVALWFPNAQQMLAPYSPALEPLKERGLFRLRLGWASGLLFGAVFFFVVRTFYVAAPSPFLYFNF